MKPKITIPDVIIKIKILYDSEETKEEDSPPPPLRSQNCFVLIDHQGDHLLYVDKGNLFTVNLVDQYYDPLTRNVCVCGSVLRGCINIDAMLYWSER